jgi:hypothetical protein
LLRAINGVKHRAPRAHGAAHAERGVRLQLRLQQRRAARVARDDKRHALAVLATVNKLFGGLETEGNIP